MISNRRGPINISVKQMTA